MTDHMVVPDVQAKAGVDLSHMTAAGKLALKRRPDVIVFLGDVFDFPSLSTHNDRGSIYYHNKSYVEDLQVGISAMERFLAPIEKHNARQKKNKKGGYNPRLVFTLGNHEFRRNRLEEQQPILQGVLPTPEQYLWDKGFEVYPYKQAVCIDGIHYCHLCPQTKSAGAVERAHLIQQKRHASWTVGHSQVLDYYVSPHEPRLQTIIAGSFYTHDEDYKTGSNDHWRGLVYKKHVVAGTYDPEFISIEGLMEDYG